MLYSIIVKYITYCFVLLFAVGVVTPGTTQTLAGVWENADRFIEYTPQTDNAAADSFHLVLKTYYRFVYEDIGSYPVAVQQGQDGSKNVYSLSIRYPQEKKTMQTDVWVQGDALFTSFYQKTAYTRSNSQRISEQPDTNNARASSIGVSSASNAALRNASLQENLLDGFWIERGHRNGILIYRQEQPDFFDAFFFMGTQYIKFRYWKGDFDYNEKSALFSFGEDISISVPKLMRRDDTVYSCITGNGSKLKNYEQGQFTITNEGSGLRLTIIPQNGGPGTHAVGDTYPHHRYPQITALPFYYSADDSVFTFGEPFLTRSSITHLKEEIAAHNSRKRSPPEPLLKADELDFYWDRIKELRKNTTVNQ